MEREKLSQCNAAIKLVSKIKEKAERFKDAKIEVIVENRTNYDKIYCTGIDKDYTERFNDKMKIINSVAGAMFMSFLKEEIEILEKEFKEL